MNLTPVLPESLPVNIEGLKPFLSIKRINPATGLPFKCGDIREDGRRFWGYTSIVVKWTGLLGERWLNLESFEKAVDRRTKFCRENPDYYAKYYEANVEKFAARSAKYYEANAEKVAARSAKYYEANVAKVAARSAKYYEANVAKIAAQRAKYYEANVAKFAAYQTNYKKANPGKINALGARRRAAKLQRTPPWLTQEQRAEIEAIYVLCAERTKVTGIPHAVDHVIPLMGRTVSGLHIAANLQIITASENSSKHNKYVQE